MQVTSENQLCLFETNKTRMNPFKIWLFNVRTCDIEELFKFKLNKINEFLSEEEKEIFCQRVCDYYHEVVGFPYYGEEINFLEELDRLKNSNVKKMLLENNELQQIMSGLNICNSFHPHMWDVKCRNQKTPKEVFLNKELFKGAIRKRLNMSDSKLKIFNVRKSLKIFSGAQSVSNFKPTVARYMYETYCAVGSTVLDPCMGYGGRLLGSIISSTVHAYHGVDPCVKTYNGNCRLDGELNKTHNDKIFVELNNRHDNRFFNVPFEDFTTTMSYDFIFTSPPYFDLEKYSDAPTQSYLRYPQYEKWVQGFLQPLIQKSYAYLKKGKYFAINVHGKKLIKEIKQLCEAEGFILEDTLYMRLSRTPGKGINRINTKFKKEPIFIWRK